MSDSPPEQGSTSPNDPAAATPNAGQDAPPAEPTLPNAWRDAKRGSKRWSDTSRPDDPNVRVVHPPTGRGIGDGKSFFFLFGLKRSSLIDQQMLARELEGIQDDIEVLRSVGFTVVVDPQSIREDFLEALTGKAQGTEGLKPVGVFWSAHGHPDGQLECCDGGEIHPTDVPTAEVAASLRLVVFSACYVGAKSSTWRTALGGNVLVVGWGRPVTIDRAAKFLESDPSTYTDLDDLITRYVLHESPLPLEEGQRYSPLSLTTGRVADVAERVARTVDALGAKTREQQTCVEVLVPLPNQRVHVVSVFVVESTQPFSETELLLAAEADVGELTAVVDSTMLLAGFSQPGYARISLVRGESEANRVVVQGFLPLIQSRDTDLTTLLYQVAAVADELELRIFGIDHS